MGKAPAFQLYASDFLVDTASWDVAELGIYCRLLYSEWVNGPLPNDPKRLARIAGCGPKLFSSGWCVIGSKFIASGDGQSLYNRRLEETREKQAQYSDKQREKGKKRASQRWGTGIATAITTATERLQPEGKPKHSSSSSSSLEEKEYKEKENPDPLKPPLKKSPRSTQLPEGFSLSDPMKTYASESGLNPNAEFEAFRDFHLAKGSVFKNWEAAFRTWCRNAIKFKGRSSSPQGDNGGRPPKPAPPKQCVQCHTREGLIDEDTGLCVACFRALNPERRNVADLLTGLQGPPVKPRERGPTRDSPVLSPDQEAERIAKLKQQAQGGVSNG